MKNKYVEDINYVASKLINYFLNLSIKKLNLFGKSFLLGRDCINKFLNSWVSYVHA